MHPAARILLACALVLAPAATAAQDFPPATAAPGAPAFDAAPATSAAEGAPAPDAAPSAPLAPGLAVPGGESAAQPAAPLGPYRELSPAGVLDWEAGLVTARAQGAAPQGPGLDGQAPALARRVAAVAARRGLFGLLCAMQIDASSTVCSAMDADARLAARVRGLVQNSRLLEAAPLAGGPVVVAVELSLRGALADAVLPPAGRFGGRGGAPVPAPPAAPAPAAPAPGPVPALDSGLGAPAAPAPAPRTGVVVDARGLGAHPALLPRLLDRQGRELYGPAWVGRELAVGTGMAVYVRDPETAGSHRRVGPAPLPLTACAASGPGRTDLVLDDESAARLAALPEAARLLGQGRVVIILD